MVAIARIVVRSIVIIFLCFKEVFVCHAPFALITYTLTGTGFAPLATFKGGVGLAITFLFKLPRD